MIHNDFTDCFASGSPFHTGGKSDGRKNVSVKEDFHCPHCGGVLSIDDIVGKAVRCQYCDSVLPVPSWLERDTEPVVLYADNTAYMLLDKGVLTPNEARERALKECPQKYWANGRWNYEYDDEVIESSLKDRPQMSFADRFCELAYNSGTDSASFAERFNEIGRKYGVEQLAPNVYLTDKDTSIEEAADRVIVRKKLSFEKDKATINAVLKTIFLILFYCAVCSPLIYVLLR